MYTNFPGNLSLTTNHREVGENYGYTKGPATETVQYHHLRQNGSICAENGACSDMWYFPSYSELSYWQYDLNSRRAGAEVSHRLLWQTDQERRNETPSCLHSAIIELVEMHALPQYSFLHIGRFDVVIPLRNRYKESKHIVWANSCSSLIDNVKCISADASTGQLYADYADIIVLYLDTLQKHVLQHLSMRDNTKLLIIGSCFTAPTDLTLNSVSFTLADQVCSEYGTDIGGSIYLRLDSMPLRWQHDRTAVARRINCGVVSRRMKLHQYATKFPA